MWKAADLVDMMKQARQAHVVKRVGDQSDLYQSKYNYLDFASDQNFLVVTLTAARVPIHPPEKLSL